MKYPTINTLLLYAIIHFGFFMGSYAQPLKSPLPAVTNDSIIITGMLNGPNPSDTLRLDIHNDFSLSQSNFGIKASLTQTTSNGQFRFVIKNRQSTGHFSLRSSSIGLHKNGQIYPSPVFSQYVFRPGDSVHVQIGDNAKFIWFSGRGASRLNYWTDIEYCTMLKNMSLKHAKLIKTIADYKQFMANIDTMLVYKLSLLDEKKDRLSPEDYRYFKADIIGQNRETLYRSLNWADFMTWYEGFGDTLLHYYGKHYYNAPADTSSGSLNPQTPIYSSYLYHQLTTDAKYEAFLKKEAHNLREVDYTPLISARFSGEIRDQLLTNYMYARVAKSNANDDFFKRISALVKTPYYQHIVTDMWQRFAVGQSLTDFAFEDAQGNPVNLDQLKGKVVFLDMWFTGCSGCVSVAEALPNVEEAFKGEPVMFLSLSIDKDKNKWLRSIDPDKKQGFGPYTYTHYTTPSTTYVYTGGSGSDHPFIKKYVPTNTYPHLMLLDKNGHIFSVDPPRPDVGSDGQQKLIALIRQALNKDM